MKAYVQPVAIAVASSLCTLFLTGIIGYLFGFFEPRASIEYTSTVVEIPEAISEKIAAIGTKEFDALGLPDNVRKFVSALDYYSGLEFVNISVANSTDRQIGTLDLIFPFSGLILSPSSDPTVSDRVSLSQLPPGYTSNLTLLLYSRSSLFRISGITAVQDGVRINTIDYSAPDYFVDDPMFYLSRNYPLATYILICFGAVFVLGFPFSIVATSNTNLRRRLIGAKEAAKMKGDLEWYEANRPST